MLGEKARLQKTWIWRRRWCVQQAWASASGAGAQLLSTVDAHAQGAASSQPLTSPIGRMGSAFPGCNRDQRLYDVGAAASWEIDIGGRWTWQVGSRRRCTSRAGRVGRRAHLGRCRRRRCLLPGPTGPSRHCDDPATDRCQRAPSGLNAPAPRARTSCGRTSKSSRQLTSR